MLAGVALLGALTLGLLARQHRDLQPEIGLAAAPWMVAGALAHALAGTTNYPAALHPLFGPLGVYVTTATTAGLLWFPFRELSVRQGSVPDGSRLASGGIGAAVALGAVLVTVLPAVTVRSALLLAAVPLVAGALAVGLGFAHHEVDPVGIGRTRALGLLVLFGHGVGGLAWALLLTDGRSVGGPAGEAISLAGDRLPVEPLVVVGVTLLVALVAVSVLGRVIKRDETVGTALGVLVAAIGLGPGVEALLRATVLM